MNRLVSTGIAAAGTLVAGIVSAFAADIPVIPAPAPVPRAEIYTAPPVAPVYPAPPPVVYAYPPPPPPVVYEYAPPAVAVVPEVYYGRRYYGRVYAPPYRMRGYEPHFARGYGHWDHGRGHGRW